MNKRRTLLLTNDDGYSASGIRALHDALSESFDIVVAAPTTEQSGIGHAFTFNRPLSHFPLPPSVGMSGWAVNGTPSDCVKFAVSHLLSKTPDLVVSGMNLGENSGISSYYSGTVAAAREGAFWRLPSIAFSICSGSETYLADYCGMAHRILNHLALDPSTGGSKIVFYNVNFPNCKPSLCRGIRATRQSMAYFDDKYRSVSVAEMPDVLDLERRVGRIAVVDIHVAALVGVRRVVLPIAVDHDEFADRAVEFDDCAEPPRSTTSACRCRDRAQSRRRCTSYPPAALQCRSRYAGFAVPQNTVLVVGS